MHSRLKSKGHIQLMDVHIFSMFGKCVRNEYSHFSSVGLGGCSLAGGPGLVAGGGWLLVAGGWLVATEV